ncbi:MAG: hypothetical protein HXY34_00795 [Candidatus Thorarchaeota archaeon]|nr:hypothetical protein [Candidatus Thorarchaeota archaeon]
MSEAVLELPVLKELMVVAQKTRFREEDPILVITPPSTDCLLSTAVICRAAFRTECQFQVTFTDMIPSIEDIRTIVDSHPDAQPVLVGLRAGMPPMRKGVKHPAISIVPSDSRSREIVSIESTDQMGMACLALSAQKYGVTTGEIELAILGSVLATETFGRGAGGGVQEFLAKGLETGLIRDVKGFRIFGTGFMPVSEALQYSIRPYIRGISGNREACERVLESADILQSSRREPIMKLSTESKQKLTAQLVPLLNKHTTAQLLGQDYELPREKDDSMLRFASQLESIGLTSWAKQEMGLALGLMLGDKAQLLRTAIDTSLAHARAVTQGVEAAFSEYTPAKLTSQEALELSSSKETLSDIGRILLENCTVPDGVLVLSSGGHVSVCWTEGRCALEKVMHAFSAKGVTVSSSSPTSVVAYGAAEAGLKTVFEVVKGLGGTEANK